MSVVIETTLGDITIDLLLIERPEACLNFLKLCKMKYYNFNLFHTIERDFIAQTGDPHGSRLEGESIYGVIDGPAKRFFKGEKMPVIKHTEIGQVSFVCNEDGMSGSQFFFTLGTDLTFLDDKHCVFAKVVEGMDVLTLLNETICDTTNRPYVDVRITHTVILDDPFPDLARMRVPSRSPSPSAERLKGGKIDPDENIDDTEGKSFNEISEMQAESEAKARATILEMVGDIPDADMAPPENVLFVCKLNPATNDDDLEIIFSRFGKIVSCEVIRDKKTGDSLQYAFVEFDNPKSCEKAYFKMDNVLIDDRRIHVDFSQSVAKVKWHGKGRLTMNDGTGHADLGKGIYRKKETSRKESKNKHRKEFKYKHQKEFKEKRRYEFKEKRQNEFQDKHKKISNKRESPQRKRDKSKDRDKNHEPRSRKTTGDETLQDERSRRHATYNQQRNDQDRNKSRRDFSATSRRDKDKYRDSTNSRRDKYDNHKRYHEDERSHRDTSRRDNRKRRSEERDRGRNYTKRYK